VVSLSQALKVWGLTILAVVLMLYGGRLSDSLIASPTATAGLRWLGVVVAAACLLPWIAFVAWSLSMIDEYHRHVVLVGTAIAFVAELLVHVAFSVMRDARLVEPNTHLVELPVTMIIWIVGIAISWTYYRLRL